MLGTSNSQSRLYMIGWAKAVFRSQPMTSCPESESWRSQGFQQAARQSCFTLFTQNKVCRRIVPESVTRMSQNPYHSAGFLVSQYLVS